MCTKSGNERAKGAQSEVNFFCLRIILTLDMVIESLMKSSREAISILCLALLQSTDVNVMSKLYDPYCVYRSSLLGSTRFFGE